MVDVAAFVLTEAGAAGGVLGGLAGQEYVGPPSAPAAVPEAAAEGVQRAPVASADRPRRGGRNAAGEDQRASSRRGGSVAPVVGRGGQAAPTGTAIGEPPPSGRRDPARAPTPDIRPIPTAAAPAGLGGVDLPTDGDGVVDLFARLPAAIGGKPRRAEPIADGAGFRVIYGDPPAGTSDGWGSTGVFASETHAPPRFSAGLLVGQRALFG